MLASASAFLSKSPCLDLSKSVTENIVLVKIEFKNNNLSILTSTIFSVTDLYKSKQGDLLKKAEEEASKAEISDQAKYLVDQKIEVLRSIN